MHVICWILLIYSARLQLKDVALNLSGIFHCKLTQHLHLQEDCTGVHGSQYPKYNTAMAVSTTMY